MLAHRFLHRKIFQKVIIPTALMALVALVSYAQPYCGASNNFYLQQSTPGDPCNPQPVAVRAIYGPSMPSFLEGEFRWYKNGALVYSQNVGSDYGWDPQYGWYSEYGPVAPGASVSAEFFDAMNYCVTTRQTFTAPGGGGVAVPTVTQTYAIICDGNGKIQFQSNMANTTFVLYILYNGTYQERGSGSSGYLEIPDFNPADADRYYVKGAVNGCSSSNYAHVYFDSGPVGGTTRSVNTNQATNTVTSSTFGATQLQGQDGSVDRWEYSFSSASGPYTNWGQAGLTSTLNTCCIGSPGQTIWVRAIVKKGTCNAVPSAATSYSWPIIPISVSAGPNKSSTGGPVTFTGSASGGNGPLSLQWAQLSGTPILPGGATGAALTVTPPNETASYLFRLTATDAYGQQSYSNAALNVINCAVVNHNFRVERVSTGPNCNGAPEAARAVYGPSIPSFLEGEFRWYANGTRVKTQTVGSDYGWFSPYGWYSEYGGVSPGTSVQVTFYDLTTGCESSPQTFSVPSFSAAPSVWQEYARMCGDNVGRVQMRSSAPGVVFALEKDVGGAYHSYGSSADGYLEDPDFNPGEANKYYVTSYFGACEIGRQNVVFYVQQYNGPPDINGNNTVCDGLGTTLTASGGTGTYEWYDSGEGVVGGSNVLSIPTSRPVGTYAYSVERTSPGGCVTPRAQVTVTVAPRPVSGTLSASSASILLGESVQITSGAGVGAPTYRASSNGGSSWNIFNDAHVGQNSFTFTPSALGTYRIQLRNQTACGFCEESYGDCPDNPYVDIVVLPNCTNVYHNFHLEFTSPPPYCSGPPTAVRAIYGPDIPGFLDGEFRWYVNGSLDGTGTKKVGSDYGWDSQFGWYSEYGPLSVDEPYYVTFYDASTGCESSPQTLPIPSFSAAPSVWQEYARMCGDNVGRVQMRSSAPGVEFALDKEVEGGYQSYGSSTDGYLEDPDFNSGEANKYYVTSYFGACEIARQNVVFYLQQYNGSPTVNEFTTICEGVGTTLTASGGETGIYTWYNAEGDVESGTNTLPIPATLAIGTYSYTVEAASSQPYGCVSPRANATVTVGPKAVNGTIAASSTSIRLGQTVEVTSTAGVGTPTYRGSSTGGATWNIFDNAHVGENSFSFKPTAVGTYRIQLRNQTACGFCADPNNNCPNNPYVDITVDQDYNYIKEFTTQIEGVSESDVAALSVNEKSLTTTFFDGLGRPMQVVNWQASPQSKDYIQPIEYDAVGRETNKYLPYISTESNAWYKVGALSDTQTATGNEEAIYRTGEQYQFYQTGDRVATDQYPYAKTVFEPSPLNRVIEQGSPGAAWQPDGTNTDRTVKFSYEANTSDDEVLKWTYTNSSTAGAPGTIDAGSVGSLIYYLPNMLYKTKTKDEQQHEVIEFKDKEGRVILKKVQASTTEWAQTYYIYDDFGNLVVVLPPEGVKQYLTQN